MHHTTDRIKHITAFVTPVVEHWLEWEIAQWVHHEGSIRRPRENRDNICSLFGIMFVYIYIHLRIHSLQLSGLFVQESELVLFNCYLFIYLFTSICLIYKVVNTFTWFSRNVRRHAVYKRGIDATYDDTLFTNVVFMLRTMTRYLKTWYWRYVRRHAVYKRGIHATYDDTLFKNVVFTQRTTTRCLKTWYSRYVRRHPAYKRGVHDTYADTLFTNVVLTLRTTTRCLRGIHATYDDTLFTNVVLTLRTTTRCLRGIHATYDDTLFTNVVFTLRTTTRYL